MKKILVMGALIFCALIGGVIYEVKTSFFQSLFIQRLLQDVNFVLKKSPSTDPIYPKHGPLNERSGYTRLPEWLSFLSEDFDVVAQAELSPKHRELMREGINPLYKIKPAAGLQIRDTLGAEMYSRVPTDLFSSFNDIPTILVDVLLFVENKELLNKHPYYNPAVEYDRFAKATFEHLARTLLKSESKRAGGSTLATQMEKYLFSEDGKTSGVLDKLKQMSSASLRSYLDGRDTTHARQRIVLDYLNSIPLGAAPRYGEVLGYGEAMRVFYQVDLIQEKELLNSLASNKPYTEAQLRAVDRVLQIVISARNPNYLSNPAILVGLKNRYIPLLIDQKILRPEALSLISTFQPKLPFVPQAKNFVTTKAQDLVRARASSLLGVTYPELDNLDLSVKSTFRLDMQEIVTSFFEKLKDENFVQEHHLRVERLLDQTAADKVTYSFVLFELEDGQSKVRASYDNFNRPFNFNDSGKMELGSTAKLRVTASYLEAVTQAFYEKQSGKLMYHDPISLFVKQTDVGTLAELLQLAMQREFSANPHQVFFTGGGVHKFQNFNKEDNSKVVSLHHAFIKSINLPFVRVLQETVRFHIHRNEAFQKLSDGNEEIKKELLLQFVEKESKLFLSKFFKNLKKEDPSSLEHHVTFEIPRSVMGIAMVMTYLHPELTPDQVISNIRSAGYELSLKQQQRILRLVNSHLKGQFNMNDIGYVAKLHPILLYVAKKMIENPTITYSQLVAESERVRIESYNWLFKNKKKQAQWIRVYSVLEAQGFEAILDQWQKIGFPFEYIVPSLATALGSSGDKPRALAKLVGIALNDGKDFREPIIEELHFAKDTPYEVILARKTPPPTSEQVMTYEVAQVIKNVLRDTVETGTAVKIKETFKPLVAGGKTGTGDNQLKEVRADGSIIDQTALSRTATFVFYIGTKWYGSITVHVDQDEADHSTFTSSYAVTLLKLLGEQLKHKL
jgi:membrane peptidoglycan carboxypeptidase